MKDTNSKRGSISREAGFFEADVSQSGVEGKQIKEIQQREQFTPELVSLFVFTS